MDKEKIISYVMNTPGNTNPAVLETLLDENDNNVFLVTLTLTSENGGIANKSNKEIYEALKVGKKVWFTGNMADMQGYFPIAYLTEIDGYQYPFIGTRFDMVQSDDDDITYFVYMSASNQDNYEFFMTPHYYVSNTDNRFIVTLTPTEQDYSGTMDMTVAEINAAYEDGMEIWFKVLTGGQDEYTFIPLSNADKHQEEYPSFATYVFDAINDILIIAWTGYTDDGTKQTYSTSIYPLTQGDNRFIVTLTPEAEDYSGTMDKTSNEITQAYEMGKQIVFNVVGFPNFDNVYIPAAWCTYATGHTLCAACATLVNIISDTQIVLISSDADNSNDYYTHIYTLTPAT